MQKGSSYKINVYTFNKTLLFEERIKKIDVSIETVVEVLVSLSLGKNTLLILLCLPGHGLPSISRHSEPKEPPVHLLFVGGLWYRPQQHP